MHPGGYSDASPFDWMESSVPASRALREKKTSLSVVEHEMVERAALLQRLGYSLAEAQMRVRGNLLWDFELHGRPPIAARSDQIVARVYARTGTGKR